jgi:hypothetical protein
MFNVGFGIGTRIGKGFDPFMFIDRTEDDLWIGNFEGVASEVSSNIGIYAKAFRIEPDALGGLRHMNLYGFANNHAMEHGPEAYHKTVKALENHGSKVFGLHDRKSFLFEHQGKKLSITGLSLRVEESKFEPLYWHNPEYKDIETEVNSLPTGTFKILYVHWGNEYINRPSVAQRKFAHWLIDAGFDLIIGMHPHVLQGYEDYNDKRIYYSLGNFVFDMPSEQCKIGALVGLDFKNDIAELSERYIIIDKDCCPHVVDESEIPAQWRFDYLNEQLKKSDNTEKYHNEIKRGYIVYRNANRRQLLSSAFAHPIFFYGILTDYVKRKFCKR